VQKSDFQSIKKWSMSDSTCQHESVLFAEYGQVQDLISILTSECHSNDSEVRKEEALTSFRRILDRYLEFPTLLDPFLTSLVIPLAEYCRDHLENECCFYSLSAIYTISKVRGRKIIPRFFPHAMNLVEPVLNQLVIWSSHHTRQKDPSYSISISKNEMNLPIWERMYVLWIWLDLLSLTPIDRHIVLHETTIPTIIKLSKEHLSESGPLRDTAASCLASWLAREDMQSHRIEFVAWSYDIWKDYPSSNSADFLPLGILQTLTTIFSKGSRSNFTDQLILWDCLLEMAEKHQVRNVLIRKYLVKWLTRMACAHMPPRLASWRYHRGGRRSLLDNLNHHDNNHQEKTIPLVTSTPTGETIIHNENSKDSLFYVPDAVEEAMGQLLLSLQDPATIVRWSASKGIGRITERLPSCCSDDVLDALLRQLADRNLQDQDTVWHGTCLTLGELTRRGLLLPHRLPDVLEPVLLPAIFFDRRKGTTSVGNHVRDAACYTYWAFARAYDPIILEAYVQRMSQALVVASLLDREINCRRAASAAFQESVGRQGAKVSGGCLNLAKRVMI
jgi:tubulin-specific chaperone D